VNLILTGAAEVRRLNRDFLRKDRDTDVIAFDYTEPERFSQRRNGRLRRLPVSPSAPPRARAVQRLIWGDVYVSAEAALEQARERGIPPREELARLFLHGCLHLLGYRDGTPAERARLEAVQESLLAHALAPARSGKRR
jgi:probable rRNA maturation factor